MYALLTETGKRQLRMERIMGLEGDHYRIELQLQEAETADEVGALSTRAAELERRIAIHRAALDAQSATTSTTANTVDTTPSP